MSYSWGDDSRSAERSAGGSGFDYRSARRAYEIPPVSSPRSVSHRDLSEERRRPRSVSRRDLSEERIRPSGLSAESRRDHDFSSARGKTPHPIDRPKIEVKTESTRPIVCCVDHTGSFIEEVRIILEKLPLLGKEVARYMQGYAICFALVGDTTSDRQPLQVRDFDHGEALDAHIKALFPEGQGGDDPESYDLAAYYFINHCEMPNAVKPLFIWVLDSNTHSRLRMRDIKRYIGDDVQGDLSSVDVLKQLATKFTVYVILKDNGSHEGFWADIYGKQHIISMREPRDIVELIIGIVAGEAGEYEDFERRTSERHVDRPDRIARVMKSTRSLRKSSADGTECGETGNPGSGPMRSEKLV